MALTDNLISYWKLDESSGNAADSVGSNTLTNNNTVTYSAGKINNGANFVAASTQWLSAGNVINNPTALSISLWVKGTAGVHETFLAKVANSAGGNSGYTLGIVAGGSAYTLLQTNGTTYAQRKNTTTIFDGTNWHHIVWTWDGTKNADSSAGQVVYVDGSSAGDAEGGSSGTVGSMSNTDSFNLGREDGGNFYLNSSIDEVGIWSRALTSAEVTSLYNGGAGFAYPFAGGGAANHWLLMGV